MTHLLVLLEQSTAQWHVAVFTFTSLVDVSFMAHKE